MTPLLAILARIFFAYTLPVDLKSVQKVLVVDLNFLGDMLMSSPVYRALKEHLPGAQVDALALRITEPALRANPFIDTVHAIPRRRPGIPWKMLFALRKERYDLVLQLNTSLKTNFVLWALGRRYRLGYDYAHRGCFNNIRVPIQTRTARTEYRVDECVRLLEAAFGWRVSDRRTIFRVPDQERARVRELLLHSGIDDRKVVVGIHTNCRQDQEQRRWDKQRFIHLTQRLVDAHDVMVVFTGAPEDHQYVADIVAAVSRGTKIRDFSGKLSLLEFAALLVRVDLFITINTGPMHLAIALQTPTVAIIGGTPARVVFPSGVPQFRYVMDPALKNWDPYQFHYRYVPGLQSITIDQVYEEVMHLLPSSPRNRLLT